MMEAVIADTILAIDDEEAVLNSVRRVLRANGFENVVTSTDPRQAIDLLDQCRPAVLLLDLIMPNLDGRRILELVVATEPDLPVIMVTAEHDARAAVECMKLGAYDYLVKPVTVEELVATVRRALEHRLLVSENAALREKLLDQGGERPEAFRSIITADPAMERVFAYLEVVAKGTHPVLITGETGTGKELLAEAVHRASGRRGPFVPVNVAGLDDTMFSDTLFGHRAGAFTGASAPRKGMAEQAGGGTLFLDEIGDLAESSQVKLLRLLQEREFYPLGADVPKRLEARVVAATHQDVSKLRRDLYYRLRAYCVAIPPLRERRADLPMLVEHFVREASADLKRKPPVVPRELFRQLERHDFPGNVRELQALVFDAVARHQDGPLTAESFLTPMGLARTERGDGSGLDGLLGTGTFIPETEWRELERTNLVNALERSHWKIAGRGGAAELLGVKASTLESRMKAFAIRRPEA